jgi:hypothetical protein
VAQIAAPLQNGTKQGLEKTVNDASAKLRQELCWNLLLS